MNLLIIFSMNPLIVCFVKILKIVRNFVKSDTFTVFVCSSPQSNDYKHIHIIQKCEKLQAGNDLTGEMMSAIISCTVGWFGL